MSNFVHLHVHSEYSLLDGACRIKRLVKKAKELSQTAVAITDHGVMYGVVDFYKAAKAEGIKPIIGCEVYTAPRSRFDKNFGIDNNYGHLVLLAKNNVGYKNLCKIVSLGYIDGFYSKPRVDMELLSQYSEGIIALSACLAGDIPQAILKKDFEAAKSKAFKYNEIFKEGFYLEIQDHGIAEQKVVNMGLINLSKETEIPLIATNDAHYIEKSDSKSQFTLMCIQMQRTIYDENKLGFETDEFYIKSYEEMHSLFKNVPEALENTVKVAEMCNVEFDFSKSYLPEFLTDNGLSAKEQLFKAANEGYNLRFKDDKSSYDRLLYELDVIDKMGFNDYYLIVADFINYAKGKGIPVGPGRGSAAGSLVSYCLKITDINPIQFNLLFERFLNPERVSMPDIDIDFSDDKRQEVIDYVVSKYGADRVVQIVTFGTMAPRAAIRDVGRALNIPYSEVDMVAKQIPQELGITIERALAVNSQLKTLYDTSDTIKNLIDTAKELEGMPRHASTHASGVVITKEPAMNHVPLAKNDEAIVAQFPMGTLEELGLLKMDFLGLRNLSIIKSCEEMIKEKDKSFNIKDISFDDKKTFELISSGHTSGVFQLESAGMKRVLVGLCPKNLEDIIAVISLFRPGPMDSIPRYIENSKNHDKITYKHPLLEDILDVTYGCIVYQEQVMQIVRKLAGYSYGRADLVRRAMSKKKHDVMEKERANFIFGVKRDDGSIECPGAVANGVPEKVAASIFDEMAAFASYAFNKSHAAAYAVVTYQTAYLKAHYSKEYMAALLTSVLDNTSKVVEYISECGRMGIEVLPPDVNESVDAFKVVENSIRFGLVAIKSIGKNFIEDLIKERDENGKFLSFYDFLKRMSDKDTNKKAIEALIVSGSLDSFGLFRSQMLRTFAYILDNLANDKKKKIEGQFSMFDNEDTALYEPAYPNIEELPQKELLKLEKDATGLYLSGHPLDRYKVILSNMVLFNVSDILKAGTEESVIADGDGVSFAAVIISVKLKLTKNNTSMAFVQAEDKTGSIECIVFPKTLTKLQAFVEEDRAVIVKGRVDAQDEREPKLIIEDLSDISKHMNYTRDNRTLYVQFDTQYCKEFDNFLYIAKQYSGDVPVVIKIKDTGKILKLSRDLWVSPTEMLINVLNSELGQENVVLKSVKNT